MNVEYTVTETIHRNPGGQIVKIGFEFDETFIIETTSTSSIARNTKEKRNRTYDAAISREQYQNLKNRLSNPLSFDAFVDVLRPFIMGYYLNDELERAFRILDRDVSGTIHIRELGSFLPVLNDTITNDDLNNHIRKVDDNFDGKMNYTEFRSLVLRGIGRDIICNHL